MFFELVQKVVWTGDFGDPVSGYGMGLGIVGFWVLVVWGVGQVSNVSLPIGVRRLRMDSGVCSLSRLGVDDTAYREYN